MKFVLFLSFWVLSLSCLAQSRGKEATQAQVAAWKRDYQKAEGLYAQAIQNQPNALWLYEAAVNKLNLFKAEEAQALLRRLEKEYPQEQAKIFSLRYQFAKRQRNESLQTEILQDFKQVIDKTPFSRDSTYAENMVLFLSVLENSKKNDLYKLYHAKGLEACIQREDKSSLPYQYLQINNRYLVEIGEDDPKAFLALANKLHRLQKQLAYFTPDLVHTAWLCEYYASTLARDTLQFAQTMDWYDAFLREYYGPQSPLIGNAKINRSVYYKDITRYYYAPDAPQRKAAQYQAFKYGFEGLRILESQPDASRYSLAISAGYRNLAFMALETGYAESLLPKDSIATLFERSFKCLLPNSIKWNRQQLPDFTKPENMPLDLTLAIYALQGWIDVNLDRYSFGETSLKKQLEDQFRACKQLVQHLEQQTLIGGKNESINHRIWFTYQMGANQSVLRYLNDKQNADLDSLFMYVEQMGGVSTRRHQDAKQLLLEGGVPPSEAQKFLALNEKLKQQKFDLALAQKEAAPVKEQTQKLIALQSEYDQQANYLFTQYPNYARSMVKLSAPSFQEVRAALPPHTALICPLQGRVSHVVAITADTLIFSTITRRGKVSAFNKLVSLPPSQGKVYLAEKSEFIREANKFGEVFFHYAKSLESQGIKHFICLPSGAPDYLFPWELCLFSPADTTAEYGELDYMLKHFSFQYISSLSQWLEAKKQNTQGNGSILGFAPSYDKVLDELLRNEQNRSMRASLSPLLGTREELQFLEKHFNGSYFYESQANEQVFKNYANSSHSVIHLAMHGLLDPKDPNHSALAFSETSDSSQDNFLWAGEIAMMKIPAQLVVLSACETGIGRSDKVEGQLSLARYFLYAGTPALVATRWQVNDQATAFIMQHFYNNLDQGQTIAVALQNAQLSFLKEAPAEVQHPFFWAAFNSMGYADHAIYLRKPYDTAWWAAGAGLGFLGLAGFAWWWRKKRQKQAAAA